MEITLRDIHKHYGPVRANDGVSLTVRAGAVHGILGENGAGKSTLMKILAGYTPRTGGEILLDGRPVDCDTPAQAAGLGIGMLYQDPLDFPLLTVLDNFRLGHPEDDTGILRDRLGHLTRQFDFSLNPDDLLRTLTIGERQQLEILRLLERGIRTLILDEPTTGISATQKAVLFKALRQLAEEGRSVVLVSHKLEDVEALCDSVTVLRTGQVTGHMDSPFHAGRLMTLMFGAPPGAPSRCPAPPGDPVLVFDGVEATGGRTGLKGCTATIRRGEVVGLAGLEGSGQGVFLRVAAGLKKPVGGRVRLEEREMTGRDHHGFKAGGVHFLPGSRLEEGLVSDMSIVEHEALRAGASGRGGFWIRWADAYEDARQRIADFRIQGGGPDTAAASLSGGNQQRLLLSFLSADPRLLLLENPTRGLDIESAHWVWGHLQSRCAESRAAIVFSSAELDEILMVADRVLVFFDGRVIKDVRTAETDVGQLGLAIAGKA
jgi:simple sugar transport system ATP-binding protein